MTYRATVPPEAFRLYPWEDDGGDFFVVNISETLDELRQATQEFCGYSHPQELACVWAMSGRGDYAKILGVIFLAKEAIGIGIVTHEMVHAGFRAMERRRMRVRHRPGRIRKRQMAARNEEVYANVVERLNRQFWNEAYERHLVEPG